MLSCRDISHHAGDYVEKQLSFRQRISYGIHLLLCGHCRHFLRHFRATLAYTRSLQDAEQISDTKAQEIATKAAQRSKQ